MKHLSMVLVGVKPLLMHNNQGVNPLHPLTREIKKITSKHASKKTDDDLQQISDLEWLLGMYYDEKTGPYIPSGNVKACIEAGAKRQRLGKVIPIAVSIDQHKIPLLYQGPRDLETLKEMYEFRDVRPAKIKGSSVTRTRPRFEEWNLEFSLTYDDTMIDEDVLKQCIVDGGVYGRLGDYRKEYGSFIPKFA